MPSPSAEVRSTDVVVRISTRSTRMGLAAAHSWTIRMALVSMNNSLALSDQRVKVE